MIDEKLQKKYVEELKRCADSEVDIDLKHIDADNLLCALLYERRPATEGIGYRCKTTEAGCL